LSQDHVMTAGRVGLDPIPRQTCVPTDRIRLSENVQDVPRLTAPGAISLSRYSNDDLRDASQKRFEIWRVKESRMTLPRRTRSNLSPRGRIAISTGTLQTPCSIQKNPELSGIVSNRCRMLRRTDGTQIETPFASSPWPRTYTNPPYHGASLQLIYPPYVVEALERPSSTSWEPQLCSNVRGQI